MSMPRRVRLGQEEGQVTRAMDGQHRSECSLFTPRAGHEGRQARLRGSETEDKENASKATTVHWLLKCRQRCSSKC